LLVALVVLGFALVATMAYWSGMPPAEPQSSAISRRGELGGADFLIEVPPSWHGGLVVFAHGIQRGQGRGSVVAPPIGSHITSGGARVDRVRLPGERVSTPPGRR
jgi:hypothetical protein